MRGGEPGDDGLRQLPGTDRVRGHADADLVRGERHLAGTDAGQAAPGRAGRIAVARDRPAPKRTTS